MDRPKSSRPHAPAQVFIPSTVGRVFWPGTNVPISRGNAFDAVEDYCARRDAGVVSGETDKRAKAAIRFALKTHEFPRDSVPYKKGAMSSGAPLRRRAGSGNGAAKGRGSA